MFTTGLSEIKEVNEKTTSTVDEALKKKKRQYNNLIAKLLESKLVDNEKNVRLEIHYDFSQEDIMKEFDSYFTTENWSIISTEREITVS